MKPEKICGRNAVVKRDGFIGTFKAEHAGDFLHFPIQCLRDAPLKNIVSYLSFPAGNPLSRQIADSPFEGIAVGAGVLKSAAHG